MLTHSSRIAFAALGVGLVLSACGASTPAATPDPATAPSEGEGGGMNMCAPGVPDCNDTPDTDGDAAADCVEGVECDDTNHGVAEGEPNGDQRMNPSISIVDAFVMQTPVVEMAPGSVEAPLRLFLQEAVVEGSLVTVSFSGGEAPCFVIDHASVEESDEMVVVTVFAGQPDPAADCSTMSTSMQAVTVELEADLGGRLLLDGSRMQGADNV